MTRNVFQTLDQLNASPKQSLGQNFCIDSNILRKIADSAQLGPDDWVMEIGPGTGALTEEIASTGCTVHLIEIDQRMEPALSSLTEKYPNITVHFGDALKIFPEILQNAHRPAVIIGNLPYNISSQLIIEFLEHRKRIARSIITLQLEMAKRLAASPSTKDYGSLSVRIQASSVTELLFRINPACFFPKPKVTSACIKIDFSEAPKIKPLDEKLFVKVVRGAFAKRRKQMRNSLGGVFESNLVIEAMTHANIDLKRRAEELDYKEFIKLTDAFEKILLKGS